MKKLLIYTVILSSLSLSAQKHDAFWMMGYAGGDFSTPDDVFCISLLDFSTGQMSLTQNQDIETGFDAASTGISDSNGKLLFYTNGHYIIDSYYEKMENGDSLNGYNPNSYSGYILNQGVLALPFPEHENQYLLFSGTNKILPVISIHMGYLYYSIIDMNLNNGKGKVTQKKIELLSDTLQSGRVTAIRHANGRDWWMLINEANTNRFYTILIDPHGPKVVFSQTLGMPINKGLGQAVFSPDGEKFILCTSTYADNTWLHIYDFDRCSGQLSNPKVKYFTEEAVTIGVAVSPSSKYLYYSLYKKILQFDLAASDIFSTEQTVAIYDGFASPFASTFFLAQLAYDGKIYINCSNTENVLHVIHNPDEFGLACNVEQHGVILPCVNAYAIPNYPNYRLYDEQGSICDSLGINTPVSTISLPSDDKLATLIYPNPFSDEFVIIIKGEISDYTFFHLYDIYGKEVYKQELFSNNSQVSTQNLLNGIYFWKIEHNGDFLGKGKIIKQD